MSIRQYTSSITSTGADGHIKGRRWSGDGPPQFYEGNVFTPYGIVTVWADTPETPNWRGEQSISFETVIGSRRIFYIEQRTPRDFVKTRVGLARMAHRWIKELVGAE